MFRYFMSQGGAIKLYAVAIVLVGHGLAAAQDRAKQGTSPGPSYLELQRLELERLRQYRQMLKENSIRQAQARQARIDREIAAFQQQQFQDKLRYNAGIYGGMFNTRPIHLDEAEYYRNLAKQNPDAAARLEYFRSADWHRHWAKKLGR